MVPRAASLVVDAAPDRTRANHLQRSLRPSAEFWYKSAMSVVLHQWLISPFCNKIRKVLAFKNIDFDTINYNGLRARDAAALSPAGKLPVLDIDGERIQDSAVIAAALEKRYPEPALYPSDPVDRARACFWEDWAGESLYWFEIYFRFVDPEARALATRLLTEGRSGIERIAMGVALGRIYPSKARAQGIARQPVEHVDARFDHHLDNLDCLLGSSAFLVGDVQTIADISVAAQLEEMIRTSHRRDRILSRSHVQRWLEIVSPSYHELRR